MSKITRPLDATGRVSVPREIIKNLDWKLRTDLEDGTLLEFNVIGNKVVINEYKQTCNCCGNEPVTEVDGIKLCVECIEKFNNAAQIFENAKILLKKIKA